MTQESENKNRDDPVELDKALGQALVADGIISQDQLKEAREIQRNRQSRLGGVLMDLGCIRELTLVRYLTREQKKPKLGELLVAMNVLTREQLDNALKAQETTREKIGAILLRENYVDKRTLMHYLSLQAELWADKLTKDQKEDSSFLKGFDERI